MRDEFRELWRYRELLLTFVIRDLRVRYKNSVLGFFWSLLNPLATVLVMTVVFKYIMGNETQNYSAYLFAAYLPWTFFSMTLLDSSQSVLLHMPLIKKIYFPREILPLSAVLSNLVHFLLALVVFFAFLLGVWALDPRVSPFTLTVFWVPLLTIPFVLLTAGCALIVAALNTFYEDTKYILSVGLYLMFFLTPVFYFSESVYHAKMIPNDYRQTVYTAYHLNPVSEYVSTYRKALLPPQPIKQRVGNEATTSQPMPIDPGLLATAIGVSVVVFFGGYRYFNRRKWEFVERP
jgi:ABC-type polysaccharide/polyol phosphate export permease